MSDRLDPNLDLDAVVVAVAEADRPATIDGLTTCASTNDTAMTLLDDDAPAPVLVTTEHQTRGRGRRGNTWSAPASQTLLMSYGFTTTVAAETLALFSPAVGLAVTEAIGDAVGARAANRVGLKWPNDVMVDDGKVAGILLESHRAGERYHVVAGIGINVDVAASWFIEANLTRATSLRAAGFEVSREQVLTKILRRLPHAVAAIERGDFVELQRRFEALSYLTGKTITVEVDGRRVVGRVVGIDLRSRLRLQADAGEISLTTARAHVVDWTD